MPELPEVETIRRELDALVAGRTILSVQLNRAGLRHPFPAKLATALNKARIVRVDRRAKYLIAELSQGDSLVMHLGMTGRFRIVRGKSSQEPGAFYYASEPIKIHDHVVFHLDDGSDLIFNDPRRFGLITVHRSDSLSDCSFLKGLGPEPTDKSLNAKSLAKAFAKRQCTAKAALLNQTLVAGIGNIYASEILFRAKLNPLTRAGALATPRNFPQITRLVKCIKQVIRQAIEAAEQHSTDVRFQVYGREGLKCVRRGCDGKVRRIVQQNRSTFFCPRCQYGRSD